ncbi:hypothetical protein BX616_004558 [Lobosporangium transversale]|uniref:Uncharacterized protein n=1 Tax=Lobosporangium transversale TaxID=64571 RepID=A0A1Y2GRY8_9FUNG|nr:hypothetical protein BCR41DRAFT_350412 [Lobosporangium transversale]KAF9898049.1 hypothetical protein BX616_004558 [Lobosporangium transversale]ORZ20866.1 hypothetical protein BCR41DRAFT_350412 [Lobosporangium transversale]|eukprot:XP_021882775.1 hypothetical protein BCR41DRAFT_350412 [Lobosporangium transversale]
MKPTSLFFITALIGAAIINNNAAEALPISTILSSPSPHRHHHHHHLAEASASASAPEPVPAPAQVSPFAGRTRPRSSASIPKHRRASKKINRILTHDHHHSIARRATSSVASSSSSSHSQPSIKKRASHQGHVVLDEEDDDAGNELLDTETEGLVRPDDDDTIEGEIIEEEGEEGDGHPLMAEEIENDIDQLIARANFMNPRKAIRIFTKLVRKE